MTDIEFGQTGCFNHLADYKLKDGSTTTGIVVLHSSSMSNYFLVESNNAIEYQKQYDGGADEDELKKLSKPFDLKRVVSCERLS